jgi:hypothetical protein
MRPSQSIKDWRSVTALNSLAKFDVRYTMYRKLLPLSLVLLICFLLAQIAEASGPDTWLFQSPNSPVGMAISRGLMTAVFDPASNRTIVFGGVNGDSVYFNDVLALTNANGLGGQTAGQWITLIANGAAGSPPARAGHSAVYDSVNNRMIIFGGCPIGSCFNDVWV